MFDQSFVVRNLRRWHRPTVVCGLCNCTRLDNLQRVAVDAKSQRCLSGRETAAFSEILEVQADDATAAALSGGEMRAVCKTSEGITSVCGGAPRGVECMDADTPRGWPVIRTGTDLWGPGQAIASSHLANTVRITRSSPLFDIGTLG